MKKQLKSYAFFDVDNTLVKIKTMRSFLKYFYNAKHKIFGKLIYKKYEMGGDLYNLFGASREFLNKRYYKQYRGYRETDVKMLSLAWFFDLENRTKDLYIKCVLQEIDVHKNNGVEIVLVSGSFEPCLFPIAKKLGIKHVLSTSQEIKNGIYTGNVLSSQIIGEGKVYAIKDFLSRQQHQETSLSDCYAYGDHISDLPMLSYVGKPHAIKGNKELESFAVKQGWPILPND